MNTYLEHILKIIVIFILVILLQFGYMAINHYIFGVTITNAPFGWFK